LQITSLPVVNGLVVVAALPVESTHHITVGVKDFKGDSAAQPPVALWHVTVAVEPAVPNVVFTLVAPEEALAALSAVITPALLHTPV
jgi:hypothetical protein